jgi:hypothetical protein
MVEFNGEFTQEVYEQLAKQQKERRATELAIHGMTLRPNAQIHSISSGVQPNQIAEAVAEAAKYGLHVEYDKKGNQVFRSYRQRDQVLRKKGWVVYDDNGD